MSWSGYKNQTVGRFSLAPHSLQCCFTSNAVGIRKRTCPQPQFPHFSTNRACLQYRRQMLSRGLTSGLIHANKLTPNRLVSVRHASLGKKHYERKLITQPIATLYSVVSDVSKYHEFVPWCKKSDVLTNDGKHMTAELEVGFNIFTERYISKVEVAEPNWVSAVSTDTNVFDHLKTEWKFTPASDPKSTWVTFQVEFQFKSAVYNELSKLFLQEVVTKMVKAFETRCVVVQQQAKKAGAAR